MLRRRIAKDDSIVASDPLEGARTAIQAETGIAVFESNIDVLKNSDVLVLAVKPQSMSHVLAELSKRMTADAPGHLDRGGDHDRLDRCTGWGSTRGLSG